MFAEDIGAFFGEGEDAQVGAVTVRVIANLNPRTVELEELGIQSSAPYLLMPSALVPPDIRALPVVVMGQSWRAGDVTPDGTGLTRITLRRG